MSNIQAAPGQAESNEPAVMPLMEHLKELRTRLIWAFVALFATTGISFIFARQVFLLLMVPL